MGKKEKYNFNVEGEPNKAKYSFEGTENILIPKELPGYSKEAGYNNFGNSKHDEQLTKDYFGVEQGDNTYGFERVRAEKQTVSDKAANGITRALIKTGTRTLNGIISPLYGAVSAIYNQDASKIWDNKLTEMSSDIESSLDKALPLYKTKREEDAHGLNKLLYANTLYGDVLDGISYSAAALGSGYTTGALLNLAGKLSVINKAGEFLNGLKGIEKVDDLLAHVNKYEGMTKVIDGTKKGLQLYSSASTEASIEGYQASNEWYESMKNELTMGGMRELTPEEDARLKELRKQVGNTTFAFNLPVIMADNAISFGRAMLGNKVTNDIVGSAERTAMTDGVYSQAKQSLVTRLSDKTYGVRKFGVPMVSEGNQEMLQYAVQKGSQDYYNKKYYNPTADDFISSMREGLYEAYGTKEGWDQGLIGALSSGIFSNATVLKTEGVKGFKNPNNDEAVNKAVEYLNSRTGKDAYKDLYQAYVRHSNLADEQDAALENKDTYNYYNATSDMFLNYVTSRIKTGKIDDLRTDLESFKKITPEQLKQQGIELSDSELTGHKQSVIDYVQTRLAKVADIEKLHNNINENYPTAPEGVKERLVHAAWSLDDSNKRIKELTENASILARKSNSTADISLINILHDYANLPAENRQSAKDAIANNPLASPHIQDELLAKLKDVDLLIERRQEFIEAYRELKEPTKQAEVAEQDKAFEAQVEEVLSKPTPTEETGETKEQAEEVLTTKAEKPKPTNQPFELDPNDLADISSGELPQFDNEGNEIVSIPETTTTEKTPISEVISQDTAETEEPLARAKTPIDSNPREIYPGLNNTNKRNEYKLPAGNVVRYIINSYLDKGIDINTKISLRHFVNSAGKNGAIISINTEDSAWIDLGNLSSYTKDDLTNDVISILTKEGKTLTPQDLGIYFSMTEKTIQLEDKDTKQPNLSELTTEVRVNGEYLIYDRNNGGWANASYDDSNLEIPVDFEDVDTFNKAELNNSRYVLLVPNGNKYSYVRLRNELLSPKDITSLFNEFKSKAVEFKNNKDLTVDEINTFNEAIDSQLFIALNPSLKVGQSLVDDSELKFKVGKFGKFQAELRYKSGKDYKSITEYFNIIDVKDVDSLLALVNKEFKDKHETDLNLKLNDLQQHVDLDKPETFRAATKPNVFNPNYGNQLVFNELNIEEQPTLVQIAKAAEPQVQDNTLNEDTTEDEDDFDIDNIVYSTSTDESIDSMTDSEIESIKKILPSFIDIQDIETIIKNLKVNGIPYGAFRKNIIYLNFKAKKGTGYHEAFHAVFRTVLSEQDIQKYLKAAKNEFKGDLKASKENLLLTNPANSNLTDTQLEELVYEEYMADKFADYMLNKSDKSIGATLKQLFRKIIELFKGLFNNTDSTTVLFDKINTGAFVNSTFQFNRFNGNDTAFKLLPRSYSKTVGLQYFTSTESRLLINTLTAKVHNAILNGDTRTRTEIFDDLAKQRFDELENDGIAWIDKLSEKGETQLAEKVASAIEDQQFVLDPNSLKGKALGLLKSEVLKRLELFNYVEKDIDSSEDAEDGDDVFENDANEIKEQLGSKDAWLTGGHDSLSKTIKQYIAFTTYTRLDPLTGKQTEFGVDEVTLYNGLTRILSDTKEDNMLNKLSLVAESNDNIKAFLDRISKEMNITKNEDGTYNISNINPEAYNTFRLFISNFKKSKAAQLMTTYATGNAEEYKVFNANTNDPKKVSRDQWFNTLHYIKENNKLTPKQLGDYVKDANKALVIGNNPKELKFLTEDDLNAQATELVRNLSKVGIDVSKVYAKYSIVRAKQDAINEYNAKNDNKILPTSVISDKSINLLSLYNVTPITSELLVGNNGFNLSALLAKNENPYNSDNDINSKLEEIADSNSYFDESIGNSSFTNAEGNRVYEIINLSYVLDKVNDFKSDTYWNKVRTGKGLTEVESKNFKFISGNYLLNKHYDALKRIELNIINGFRNEADTEGITFGKYDQRTYFANALALFGKTTKGGLVRYIFRQNEASSTAYTATGPKINALNVKGGLTTEVLNAFYDKFLSEFNRIGEEYSIKDSEKQLIKGYNDSTEKGRAYRFTEFSYLAFINPKLYNDLTRMAQEGNLEELKANEGKVKNAIEYYLLQEGFARFKEQLDLIGFNTKDNSFVSKNLIAEYGDMDKALKEFYINDYLMSSSINELLDGDYALSRASKGFKTITVDGIEVEVPKVAYGIDISKRNKGGMASGPDYGKGNHKVTYIKDINGYIVTNSVDGSFIRVTEQDGRLIGDNGVEYTKDDVSEITTNDAQSYASQYHHIFGSMRLGRLDKRAMNIYKDLIQFTKRDSEGNIVKNVNIPEVDQEYLEKSMASANSKKTITFDGIAGIYHKLSEAGLWRSSISYIADEDVDTFVEYTTAISDLLFKDRTDGKLYKDLVSELADLYKPIPGMEALHSLANKMDKASIDQAITESASKGATIKPQDMFTGDLDVSSTLVRNNVKRLQTETPTGKDVITAGSQLINLIDTELDDTYEIEGYGTLGDIRDRYRTLMSESRDNSFKQAMKYIEMFADGSIDITKLREKLVRSLEANNADESMMELFDKGYNLNLSAIIDKAEQIVLAHFSKGVLNQKVNGTKVSLMSDAGITVVRNEDGSVVGFHEVVRNPEKYKDYNKSSLRYNVKDDKGRRFSECMLSERILTKHGLKLGDTISYSDIKNYPELFEAIGYRIPTQGHQSMMALNIVGLLPNYYEGVGIFPMEIIYLSGADFDIDSEFIQLPQFWIKDGKPVVYGTEKTDEDKLKALKYYNLNYNKEFKAEYKKQLKAVVERNKKLIYESVAKLFGIPTDIKGLQTYKTNAEINNEALRLMIVMLTNDYVQNNSANSGTTTDPMAEVSNDINTLLEEGVKNSSKKVPDDYLSASDVNGKSISNAKNSAGKAGIGIVANKVQQLTLLLKNNLGKGTPLLDKAFKWAIGGKESNGYMSKVDDNRVMDIMGVLLNVMTDNAKDPIAGNMNLSLTLLNGYTEFLAQGANKYEAALVLNQPSVQLYGKLKQIPNYTLKNNDEESLKNAHKIFKAAIAKIVYGSYDKATLDNLETKIQNDFGIDLNNPKSINLEVKQMEGVLKNDASIMNTDTYKLLQVNALVQFRELEKQADDISNLNTYLTLNQGLDISFAELRHKLEKAHEKLSTKLNPKVHVDILPLVSKDSLTYGNIKRATEVLKLGGKIFIEQSSLFRKASKGLEYSLNDSYLNKKKSVKKLSRDFLSYVSTASFKKYLNDIIANEPNETKRKEAETKLKGLNYALVYPELGSTIAEQLNTLKNSDKSYIRNNALIKYLKPISKKDDKKGIDYIDGKSFAKESPETISTLVDGFKELMFNTDPLVNQFAINLFNYSIVKDNLQFKFGSIMKYLAPGMFHTYSSTLDSINSALNTNDNNALSDFDTMGYNFRKLFVTYVANKKDVTKYKSIANKDFTTIEGNTVKFKLSGIANDEKLLKNANDIFDNHVNDEGKYEGFDFPQFYTFNGNVYELKEVNGFPHNPSDALGNGYSATYNKLEYHGNTNVSPYSNNTYEDAIRTDKQIAEFNKPVKAAEDSKPDVIEKNEYNLVDSSDLINFVNVSIVNDYESFTSDELGLSDDLTTDDFKC